MGIVRRIPAPGVGLWLCYLLRYANSPYPGPSDPEMRRNETIFGPNIFRCFCNHCTDYPDPQRRGQRRCQVPRCRLMARSLRRNQWDSRDRRRQQTHQQNDAVLSFVLRHLDNQLRVALRNLHRLGNFSKYCKPRHRRRHRLWT